MSGGITQGKTSGRGDLTRVSSMQSPLLPWTSRTLWSSSVRGHPGVERPLLPSTAVAALRGRGHGIRSASVRTGVCLLVALTPARVGGVLLGDRFYSMVTKHFTILSVQLHRRWADYRTDGLRPRLNLQRPGAEWGRRRNYGNDSKGQTLGGSPR
jgi:hypothetical protein